MFTSGVVSANGLAVTMQVPQEKTCCARAVSAKLRSRGHAAAGPPRTANRADRPPDEDTAAPTLAPALPLRPAAGRLRARYLRAPARPGRRGRRPPPWGLQPSAGPQLHSAPPERPADQNQRGRDHFRRREQVGRVGGAASGGRAPASRASGSRRGAPGPCCRLTSRPEGDPVPGRCHRRRVSGRGCQSPQGCAFSTGEAEESGKTR